jgi:hypothetical protein
LLMADCCLNQHLAITDRQYQTKIGNIPGTSDSRI